MSGHFLATLPHLFATAQDHQKSGLTFSVVSTSGLHPIIHCGNLELPQPPNPVRGESFAVDPPINRVPRHPEMLGDLLD